MQILKDATDFTMVGTRKMFLFVPQMGPSGMRVPALDWKLNHADAMEEVVWLFPGEQIQYEGQVYTVRFHPDDTRDYPVEFVL